jgi:DNA-3-methyladenine glycosylase
LRTNPPNPPLPESFYARDTVTVARALLGKLLVTPAFAAPIVEVEAYLGREDKAAHASRGITPRTRVIYGPPGRAYVYLIYGIHECLNVIAEPDGTPGCVLVRAVAGVSGPGRLTKAFAITRAHNAAPLFLPDSPLRIHDSPLVPAEILTTPRIGISHCRDWPLRFVATHLVPSNGYVEIHDFPRI